MLWGNSKNFVDGTQEEPIDKESVVNWNRSVVRGNLLWPSNSGASLLTAVDVRS